MQLVCDLFPVLKYVYLLSYICLLSVLQVETENIQMWEWDEFKSLERRHTIWGAGPIPQGYTTRPIPQYHKKEDQSSSN